MNLEREPDQNSHTLHVVLVRTRNPLNIGAVARAMANFGYSKLRLVAPYDLAFREARSAVGAGEILTSAEVYESVADAVADCHLVIGTTSGTNRQPKQTTYMLPDAGSLLNRAARTGTVAILFGSEKRGLANEDLSYCHALLQIPTAEATPSMNLAQAVGVVLYELRRSAAAGTKDAHNAVETTTADKADMKTLGRLTESILEASKRCGYAQPDLRPTAFEEKLRRLVLRMQLSQADAETWTAMFRQILWKMGPR